MGDPLNYYCFPGLLLTPYFSFAAPPMLFFSSSLSKPCSFATLLNFFWYLWTLQDFLKENSTDRTKDVFLKWCLILKTKRCEMEERYYKTMELPDRPISKPRKHLPVQVSSRNARKRCEICSKLTIKTPERPHWRSSGVIDVVLVSLLLTLNIFRTFF